jgi:hypothetical protein
MSYTLLIFECIPERTELYYIPNDKISAKQFEYLHQAQDKFINVDEMNDGLRFLNTALDESGEIAEEGFEEYKGCFAEYKWEDKSEAITDRDPITNVFLSGFAL